MGSKVKWSSRTVGCVRSREHLVHPIIVERYEHRFPKALVRFSPVDSAIRGVWSYAASMHSNHRQRNACPWLLDPESLLCEKVLIPQTVSLQST